MQFVAFFVYIYLFSKRKNSLFDLIPINKFMKEQFTLEYDMKSAPVSILWNYIASPQGLAQWFADDVVHEGKSYIFTWEDSQMSASLLSMRQPVFIKFRWNDEENRTSGDKTFFEMKIEQSELTDTTTLVITDFAEPDEKEESITLWNHEVEELQRLMGCL